MAGHAEVEKRGSWWYPLSYCNLLFRVPRTPALHCTAPIGNNNNNSLKLHENRSESPTRQEWRKPCSASSKLLKIGSPRKIVAQRTPRTLSKKGHNQAIQRSGHTSSATASYSSYGKSETDSIKKSERARLSNCLHPSSLPSSCLRR